MLLRSDLFFPAPAAQPAPTEASGPLRLLARRHTTRSQAVHLRVGQSAFSERAKAALQRVGSPARWLPATQEWDYPLTPAAVIAADTVAKQLGAEVVWEEGLREYAEAHVAQAQTEHEVRIAIERIIRDGSIPLEGFVTRTVMPDGKAAPPLRHQQVLYHWAQRSVGILMGWEMGCISGETIIKIRRHGKVYGLSLADLYSKFNEYEVYRPWKKPGITTCKSLCDDGVLRHNAIKAVLDSGVKPCLKIRLRSGKSLICTPDHEIRQQGCWTPARELKPGSIVLTNGRAPQAGELNHNWKRGWMLTKDGYRSITGMRGHPMASKTGQVLEHRLVMAKVLGRNLMPKEVVHHINGDRLDNRPENLGLTDQSSHASLHGAQESFANLDGGTAGTGGEIILLPRKDIVESVEDAGEHHVYDIVMADPARNFAANGIIVHNCGKTRAAADASGGWYRNHIIRPMAPAMPGGKPGVEGGVLVVCPKTMMKTWQVELWQWQSAQSLIVAGDATRKARLAATPSHFHIINYQSLKHVEHNEYDGVILDEIHSCANDTAQKDRALQLARRARRRLGLSGTPITNSLESIFYPMLILDGGKSLGPNRTAFLERYFNQKVTYNGETVNEPRQDAIPQISAAIAQNSYWVKKSEVLDLPEKTFTPVYLDMTPEQLRYYNQVKKETVAFIQDASVTVEQASARMMKLLQICQGFVLADDSQGRHFTNAKIEALRELLTLPLLGKKVVVWAYFLYEIERLCALLKEINVKHVAIHGGVKSQRDRDAAKDRFNTDDELLVFVRQLSMSEGVTLLGSPGNPCSHTAYVGMSYSYTHWAQSQDRIHRIGQRFPCSYTVMLTSNGIDRNVYDRVLTKEATALSVRDNSKDYYLSLLQD